MPGWLTPARRRGVEILDRPETPDAVRAAAMADVKRSNVLFGGGRAALLPFRDLLAHLPSTFVVLDVGAGMGDIAQRVCAEARRAGRNPAAIAVDSSALLARVARQHVDGAIVGDALRLPLRDRSADIVICSQLLHHFSGADERGLVAELHRVSRGWVIIADLRRSWLPVLGFWLASVALRFHPVTRADGVTSILRGFTPAELRSTVREVTGVTPRIRRGIFWRVSATWQATRR